MNQAETLYQEILHTLDKLLVNLGLLLEDYNVEYLSQADLYLEIYKVMFPVLEPILNVTFPEEIADEELIQYLIDILSKEIIKMDLGHIKGQLIAQGDLKTILNFMQLLYEISKMAMVKEDERHHKSSKRKKNPKPIKSSGNSLDQSSSNQSQKSSVEWEQKYRSVQGIQGEFSNSSGAGDSELDLRYSEANYDGEAAEALFDERPNLIEKAVYEQQKLAKAGPQKQKNQSVSIISEASKSKESSEYERGAKKPSREFNPAALNLRNVEGGEATKYGSCTSEDIKDPREEDEPEEEEVIRHEEEEEEEAFEYEPNLEQEEEAHYQGGYDEEYIQEGSLGLKDPRFLYGDDDIIEEEEELSSDQRTIKATREQGNTSETEYATNDPMNRSQKKNNDILKLHKMDKKETNKSQKERNRIGKHKVEQRNGEAQQRAKMKGGRRRDTHDETRGESTNAEERGSKSNTKYTTSLVKVNEERDDIADYEERYEKPQKTKKSKPNPLSKVLPSTKGYPNQKGSQKLTKSVTGSFRKDKPNKSLATSISGSFRKEKPNKSMATKIYDKRPQDRSQVEEKKLSHSKSEKNLATGEVKDSAHQKPSSEEESSGDRGLQPKGLSAVEDAHLHHSYEGQEHEQYWNPHIQQLDVLGQDIPNGNLYRILSENIVRAKENMRENKNTQDIPFDDEKTVKAILHQKNQYKQYLNDFIKEREMREKKYEQMMGLSQKNLTKKLKSETIKDNTLRKEFEDQKKSFYYKMRDEKVNFLRHIHKAIFSFEKTRVIQEKKDFLEHRKSRNEETQNMIDSVKNDYKNKLDILRERNVSSQFESKIANDARRQFFRKLQSDIKADQTKEVERLKDKWRFEKEKLELMMRDEGFLEKKVMQLYKQGAF